MQNQLRPKVEKGWLSTKGEWGKEGSTGVTGTNFKLTQTRQNFKLI